MRMDGSVGTSEWKKGNNDRWLWAQMRRIKWCWVNNMTKNNDYTYIGS